MSGKTLLACASCGKPRGNSRSGWTPVTRGEAVVGYVCAECPRPDEPIRRLLLPSGAVRFRAVVDSTRAGSRDRKQATSTHQSVAGAREWVATVREAVGRDGTYMRSSDSATVADLAARWVASRIGIREVSRQGYEVALRPALAYLGNRRVTDVRRSEVQQFLAWALREGGKPRKGQTTGKPLSPRSVRYAWLSLALVFDAAVGDGLIPVNPARQVKKSELPRDLPKRKEHWKREQMVAFKEQADLDPLAGLFRLSLSGLTRSDIAGLSWADLDLDLGLATVRQGRVALRRGQTSIDAPKSAQRRRVVPVESIWPGSTALLRQLKAAQAADRLVAGASWADTGLVLVDALGQPLHPERYSERFRRIASEAGLPSIRLHALRHSLAYMLNAAGVLPSDAASLLGHRTDVYLASYLPEVGQTGASNAASMLGRSIAAAAS